MSNTAAEISAEYDAIISEMDDTTREDGHNYAMWELVKRHGRAALIAIGDLPAGVDEWLTRHPRA